MLPYVEQQLYYAFIAATPALIAWFATKAMAENPWKRLFLVSGIVAPIEVGLAVLIDHYFGFRLVAFLLYGNFILIPILALIDAVRKHPSHKTRSKIIAILCLVELSTVAFALFVEPNRLEARHEVIEVAKWPKGQALKIAHVSDLQTVGFCDREAKALALVNDFEPDFVIFTGDYIAGPFNNPEPAIEAARSFLSQLRPKIATIVVDGHSEPDALRARVFAGLNLIHLKNREQSFPLPDGRNVNILGLDVHHPRLSLLDAPRRKEDLFLAVSHVPDLTVKMVGKGVDLHLAGHTHGGQVVVPGLGALVTLSSLPRRYARGLHNYEDHPINITAGIGMEGNHAPRLRLFCPPEVVLIEMVGTENPE